MCPERGRSNVALGRFQTRMEAINRQAATRRETGVQYLVVPKGRHVQDISFPQGHAVGPTTLQPEGGCQRAETGVSSLWLLTIYPWKPTNSVGPSYRRSISEKKAHTPFIFDSSAMFAVTTPCKMANTTLLHAY